jgi:hypothetical protein
MSDGFMMDFLHALAAPFGKIDRKLDLGNSEMTELPVSFLGTMFFIVAASVVSFGYYKYNQAEEKTPSPAVQNALPTPSSAVIMDTESKALAK